MTEPPIRKPNRVPGYDYTQNGMYFITICTRDKENLFWNSTKTAGAAPPLNEAGRKAAALIEKIGIFYPNMLVEKYVIMPNHVHLLLKVMPGNTTPVSTALNQIKGHITRTVGFPCWQKGFHDHIVRNDADYLRIWQYIENNPAKWRLDCFYQE